MQFWRSIDFRRLIFYSCLFSVTIPRGDIILEYGKPLTIFCVLNVSHPVAANKSSSDLVFFHDSKEVPQDLVTVVNSTTLEIHIEKPPISSSMYYCKLKTGEIPTVTYTAICLNRVVVERKCASEGT
jgi:hypothetical protein